MELLLQKFGNRDLFNKQYSPVQDYSMAKDESVQEVLRLMLKYKKVLEQEIFIQR